MSEKIQDTSFKQPLFKIINNVTAENISDPNKIKDLLIQQFINVGEKAYFVSQMQE